MDSQGQLRETPTRWEDTLDLCSNYQSSIQHALLVKHILTNLRKKKDVQYMTPEYLDQRTTCTVTFYLVYL